MGLKLGNSQQDMQNMQNMQNMKNNYTKKHCYLKPQPEQKQKQSL